MAAPLVLLVKATAECLENKCVRVPRHSNGLTLLSGERQQLHYFHYLKLAHLNLAKLDDIIFTATKRNKETSIFDE